MRQPFIGIALKRYEEDTIKLQPYSSNQEQAQTFILKLKECKWETRMEAAFEGEFAVVLGILGVLKLTHCTALVTISAAKEVASLHGYPVFQVTKTEVLLPSRIPQADHRYVELLKKGVDPEKFGRGLYFSYGLLLTQTTERMTGALCFNSQYIDASWKLEDDRFFWNEHLSQPFIDLKLHEFVLPVIQGFISQLKELTFHTSTGNKTAILTLIARRSVRRLGTRNWRRGADQQGAVANFVETEQVVSFSDGDCCSFVQIRGSIPVFWTSIPNIKYKAPTELSSRGDYGHAFSTHISELLQYYKECVGVNLAHATGSEGKLTTAFDEESRRFSRIKSGFRLVHFDFHKECGTANYHRLSLLLEKLNDDFNRFSQFKMKGKRVISAQSGVIRTNCVDCLDRTNVVQGVLGKKALESFLLEIQVMRLDQTLERAFPEIEKKLKVIWADHGDEISLQYAGTGALKSGFTRTGKRTVGGLIDDGIKSVVRYYLNNFEDGEKQDALDLVSGNFVIGQHQSRPDLQANPDVFLYLISFLLLYSLAQVLTGMWAGDLVSGLLCLAIVGALARLVLIPYGPNLICKPCLRTDLPKQW